MWLAIAATVATRLHYLVSADFVIDADEGIVGIMAKHIFDGDDIPTFYYGQHYMGSFEALCAAISFAFFGISSFALKIVPATFAVLLVPVVYCIASRLGGIVAARFAALFLAFPPSALLLWSSMARGGFIEIVFIGALAVLFAIDWLRAERPELKLTMLIGMLLGFGWWVNNQIVFFILPIGLFLGLKLLRLAVPSWLTHGASALIAFFVGGLPFWIYNFEHNFVSFGMLKRAKLSEMAQHLNGVGELALPILLGAKRFWHEEDLFPGSTLIVYALFLSLLLSFFLFRKRQILTLFKLKVGSEHAPEMILCFVVAAICIFVTSSFGYLVQAPRYLLPIYVGLYALCGLVLAIYWERSRLIAALLALSILAINLASSYLGGVAVAGEPFVYNQQRVAHDHRELISWLNNERYSFIRTNYWIGYRLAFETEEQIKFKLFQHPRQVRIPEYEIESATIPDSQLPFVLVPAQAVRIRSALNGLGYNFRESVLSGYVVIDKIEPRGGVVSILDNSIIKASALFKSTDAALALDQNLDTRWGSGAPQAPGMTFELGINNNRELRGFEYDLGKWYHDYPRGLKVERELVGGAIEPLCEVPDYQDLHYLLDGENRFACYFTSRPTKRLILTQTGQDQVFDWSIAEIRLFG